MTKFLTKGLEVYAFLKTPRGKRDIALVVAAFSGVVDVLKQFGVV